MVGRSTESLGGKKEIVARHDISDKLIHFTKGATEEAALENLLLMVGEGCLRGGNGMVKGGYRCVCFTEAPLPMVADDFMNDGSFARYSPFGLMFDKAWVHARGGRQVIYQPDAEFEQLPEQSRWRHVRYEPGATPPIDFTWEREWRVRADELTFVPSEAVLVVPNLEWEEFVFGIWDAQQELETEMYSTILEAATIELMHQPCPWRIARLVV